MIIINLYMFKDTNGYSWKLNITNISLNTRIVYENPGSE